MRFTGHPQLSLIHKLSNKIKRSRGREEHLIKGGKERGIVNISDGGHHILMYNCVYPKIMDEINDKSYLYRNNCLSCILGIKVRAHCHNTTSTTILIHKNTKTQANFFLFK